MNHSQHSGRSGVAFLSAMMVAILLVPWSVTAQSQETPSSPTAAPEGDSDRGGELYNSIGCWQCHGYSGQGGVGSRVAPDPLPFSVFSQYIRTPRRQMPPYSSKVVSDTQLADIYAFLKTIPQSRDPKDIPLLNQYLD
jgi:mono/diheme cytochrome c family protein